MIQVIRTLHDSFPDIQSIGDQNENLTKAT
jgi:hypothetical protein